MRQRPSGRGHRRANKVILELMSKFNVGEEVRFDGEVYVIAGRNGDAVPRYRLLSSRPGGTRFVIAQEDELEKIASYLTAHDDTDDY